MTTETVEIVGLAWTYHALRRPGAVATFQAPFEANVQVPDGHARAVELINGA